MMLTENDAVIGDILQEHYEELQRLWLQRQTALRSASYGLWALATLDERILAHADGLVIAGPHSVALLKEGLAAEQPEIVFASAYPLWAMDRDDTRQSVLAAFQEAKGGGLAGFSHTLCHSSITFVLDQLTKIVGAGSAPVASTAAEVLACHAKLDLRLPRFSEWMGSDDPVVRSALWRVAGFTGRFPEPQVFEFALRDSDAAVRSQALVAAAWTRQSWLPDCCRKLAAPLTPDSLQAALLLAALAAPEDVPRLLAFARITAVGPRRFEVLGSLGHPAVIEPLLAHLNDPDPLNAVAARLAFTKITGCDIESNQRRQLPPEDGHEPDEFEKEFLGEAKLPDVQAAQNHWAKVKPQLSRFTRVCRGFDLSHGATPEILDQLDMESRWETCLRGKFEGTWQGNPMDLERFPQRKSPGKG